MQCALVRFQWQAWHPAKVWPFPWDGSEAHRYDSRLFCPAKAAVTTQALQLSIDNSTGPSASFERSVIHVQSFSD